MGGGCHLKSWGPGLMWNPGDPALPHLEIDVHKLVGECLAWSVLSWRLQPAQFPKTVALPISPQAHWALLDPSGLPLLPSHPPQLCPHRPFSRPLTPEPGAEVWHQRPPVGWTAVLSAAWAPIRAPRGLAVPEQFRTSRPFLLERGQKR